MCKYIFLGQICPKSTDIKVFKVAKIDWLRYDKNLKQVMLRMFRHHILMWCWDYLDLTIFWHNSGGNWCVSFCKDD